MTDNRIEFEEIDGQIGAGSSGKIPLAIAGLAVSGDYTPKSFARLADALAHYVGGDLLEAVGPQTKDWKGPVLTCRIQCADTGSVTLDDDGLTGTSVPSVHSGAAPIETGDYRLKVGTGTTIGVDGGTYFLSYDGGETWSAETALGTASAITLSPTVGAIQIDFSAGTLVADDIVMIRTEPPEPTAAEVAAAVEALGRMVQDWECLEVSCAIDKTIAAALDSELVSQAGRNCRRWWIANTRLPALDETISEFQAAIVTEWTGYTTTRGVVVPADCWYQSRVSLRTQRRPRVWAVAPYIERLPRQRDAAWKGNGIIPGLSLIDDEGNPEFHDEQLFPGLDAARMVTLFTAGTDGVRIWNPRLKSAADSDYRYIQHRRVMNFLEEELYKYLELVLHADVLVSKKTGKPTPSYVRRVKELAETRLRTVAGVGPMVSDVEVNPDENALILQTEEWGFELGVLMIGYTKRIWVRVLMRNPAVIEV